MRFSTPFEMIGKTIETVLVVPGGDNDLLRIYFTDDTEIDLVCEPFTCDATPASDEQSNV